MCILLRLPNWVGDVVMSLGAVRAVSTHFPEAELEVIVSEHMAELVAYFPGVKKVHAFPRDECRGLRKLYKYGRSCRSGSAFTHYFAFPLSFSSAWMGFAAGAGVRVGFRSDMRSFLLTHAYEVPQGIHRAESYAYLLRRYFSLATLNLDTSLSLAPPSAPILPKVPLRIALSFVSNNTARTLPVSLAQTYINRLAQRYEKAHFFMIGASDHRAYNEQVVAGCSALGARLSNWAAKVDLLQLGQLLTEVDILISTESGPSHLANSLGTPLLLFCGASDEHITGPYIRRNQIRLRASGIPCAPCFLEVCKYGEPRCLRAIDVEDVLSATEKLLNVNPVHLSRPWG